MSPGGFPVPVEFVAAAALVAIVPIGVRIIHVLGTHEAPWAEGLSAAGPGTS